MDGSHPRPSTRPAPSNSVYRGAKLEEGPASGTSAAQSIRRQSREESPDPNHDSNGENRPSERREGGEGGQLVCAETVDSDLDTDVS